MTEPGAAHNVGSIVGQLSIDDSDWNRAIDAAKRKAEELGRVDPNIRISTNAPSAIAQLKSVAAAMASFQDAQGRLSVAQGKLNELQAKGDASASKLASSSQAVARAHRATEVAALGVTEAYSRLQTGADDAAASTSKLEKSTSSARREVGLLGPAIVAIGPALVPLSAAAIGLGGALGAMGVAGVFAFKGVQAEMKAGTPIGQKYAGQLDILKGNLTTLERTAANGVLGPFTQAVARIQTQMPDVNRQMGSFSAITGAVGGNVLTGVIAAFHSLEPLLMQSGTYVLGLSQKFATFAANGGFQRFVSYAQQALPQVTSTLGQVAQAILAITGASGSMGMISTQAMQLVAQAINAIPVGVLHTLVPLIAAGYLAFKAWAALAPVVASIRAASAAMKEFAVTQQLVAADTGAAASMRALGAAGGFAALGIAGLSAAAVIGAVMITRHMDADKALDFAVKQSTQTVEGFKQALIASNGALSQNVQGTVAASLQQSGLADRAAKAGISLKDLSGAVTGTNEQLATLIQRWQASGDPSGKSVEALALLADHYRKAGSDAKAYAAAIAQTTTALTPQQAALAESAARYGTNVTAYQAATASIQQNAVSLAATTLQMQIQNNAAGLLKGALDALNGKQLSAAQAQNAFEQQLVGMAEATKQSGGALGGMSQAAITNRGNLIQLVQAAQTAAGAAGDLAGSSQVAKDKLAVLKKQIIDNAVAHGEDRQAVENYVGQLLKIPKTIPPTKLQLDTSAALRAIADVKAQAATISQQAYALHFQSDVTKVNSSVPPVKHASGGTVGGSGGPRSDNQLIWASPGEEIVQNGPAQKYRAVIKAINADKFADGGTVGGGSGIVTLNPTKPKAASGGSAGVSKAASLASAAAQQTAAAAAAAATQAATSQSLVAAASAYLSAAKVATSAVLRASDESKAALLQAKAAKFDKNDAAKGSQQNAANLGKQATQAGTIQADQKAAAAYQAAAGAQSRAGNKNQASADTNEAKLLLQKAADLKKAIEGSLTTDAKNVLGAATGSVDQVRTAMDKIIADAGKAAQNGLRNNNLVKILQQDNTKLQSIAAQRAGLADKIAADTQALADAQGKYDSEKANVSGAITGGFNITNVGGSGSFDPFGGASGGAQDLAGFIKTLTQRAADASKFSSNESAIGGLGLNSSLLAQIGEAGVSGGGQVASLLLGANSSQINTINSLFAQVQAAGNATGSQVAGSVFGGQLGSAGAALAADKASDAALQKQAATLAAAVSQAVSQVRFEVVPNQGAFNNLVDIRVKADTAAKTLTAFHL